MKVYWELYKEGPEKFFVLMMIILPFFIRMGLARPYSVILQSETMGKSLTMMLNGIGGLIGATILYLTIKGKFVRDIRKRIVIMRTLLLISSISLFILTFYQQHTILLYIIYLLSIFSGQPSFATMKTDYQYSVFKIYNMRNRLFPE